MLRRRPKAPPALTPALSLKAEGEAALTPALSPKGKGEVARSRHRSREVVLVTGFEPFGGESVNPSWDICGLLGDEIAGMRVETCRVPCEFRRSIQVAASGNNARAGFIHVPWSEQQVLDKRDAPCMALPTMLVGVRAAIAAARENREDIRESEGQLQ